MFVNIYGQGNEKGVKVQNKINVLVNKGPELKFNGWLMISYILEIIVMIKYITDEKDV